ncbi:helix-turn-helix XRE domain protein [Geotalea daltonii FRC-32]|uniref:Helix-turn-helix XRE domain protein n=1 Tax=Geotalea daltonii (strain DSM 22248 / JCM 15807 / FRC-32) TaxID=316067 RepID=B9M800_GEODF|nr:helix-turn-helix transcriptional regulator [Geotalea daltonii]ACM18458.1 helix-turn-helix XRE domain protein [Geotalea daltonii FRC-32]
MSGIRSPKELGEALRQKRKAKGLTQTAAGKPVNLVQSKISQIENGTLAIELSTLFRLLAALDLELVVQPRQKHEIKGDEW